MRPRLLDMVSAELDGDPSGVALRLLIGICLGVSLGCITVATTPAHAQAPGEEGAKKASKKKTAKEKAAAHAARKALVRKMVQARGLREIKSGGRGFGDRGLGGLGALGATGLKSIGPDFRKADAAYERGDWARAQALYMKANVLSDENLRFGAVRSAARYGHACQAIGRARCAIDAADALHRSAGRGLGAMLGRRRSKASRVSQVMHELVSKRRRAHTAMARGDRAKADTLLAETFKRDPRCPGRTCPPFVLREMSEVHARRGEFESARGLLEAFLKALPKHPERRALRREMKAWESAAKQAKADEAAALEANRVRIPKPGPKAPWFKTAKRTPQARFGAVRFGGTVGVAQMRVGKVRRWMGVRRGTKMVDGLAIPADPKWVGVGGDAQIYYATESGALHRATLEAARAPFMLLGAAPGATHWDVQGSTVVASDDTHVWVWAKGATTPHAYTHPERIGKAWTRADGVVVFGDARAAYVSADGGRTWTRTALGDMRGLRRRGQQIAQRPSAPMPRGSDLMPDQPGRCAQGALTVDLKWVAPGESHWQHGKGWDTVFSVKERARMPRGLPDGVGLAAVKGGDDAAAEIAKCRADREAYFGGSGGGGIAGGGRRCAGLGCMDAPPVPHRPVRFGLLGDGECAPDDGAAQIRPEAPKRGPLWRREPSMCPGLTRAGTLVRVTAEALEAVPPIKDCAPERVYSVGGLGVVSCIEADGGRALVVLDGAGAPRERLSIAGRPGHLGVADDGTIVAAVHGEASIDGAVRRPLALGAANAWRIERMPDARIWRPGPQGNAIALTPGSKGEPVFERPRIVRTRVDGERDYRRWSAARIEALKACHAASFAADPSLAGRVFLTLTIDEAGTLTSLATDNRLKGDSADLLTCMTGVLEGDSHPKAAATETAYLTLKSQNNSLRAWLTAPDASVVALTEDVLFERPPRQLVARDDGSIAVDPASYPRTACTLPKAGAFLCPKAR